MQNKVIFSQIALPLFENISGTLTGIASTPHLAQTRYSRTLRKPPPPIDSEESIEFQLIEGNRLNHGDLKSNHSNILHHRIPGTNNIGSAGSLQ